MKECWFPEVILSEALSKLYEVPLPTHPLPQWSVLSLTTLLLRYVIDGVPMSSRQREDPRLFSVLMEEPGLCSRPEQPMPLAQTVSVTDWLCASGHACCCPGCQELSDPRMTQRSLGTMCQRLPLRPTL